MVSNLFLGSDGRDRVGLGRDDDAAPPSTLQGWVPPLTEGQDARAPMEELDDTEAADCWPSGVSAAWPSQASAGR